jgi:hypothetical protein
MKSFFLRAILIAGRWRWGRWRAVRIPTPRSAHEAVLDLAGAFTNDGFKLRDGDITGTLKTGEATVIQVNLYAGNEYWFSVATADPKTTVSISLYDETGKLLKTNPYSDPHRAAAGYAPDTSGPYYVRVANAGVAATYCLIYSYK